LQNIAAVALDWNTPVALLDEASVTPDLRGFASAGAAVEDAIAFATTNAPLLIIILSTNALRPHANALAVTCNITFVASDLDWNAVRAATNEAGIASHNPRFASPCAPVKDLTRITDNRDRAALAVAVSLPSRAVSFAWPLLSRLATARAAVEHACAFTAASFQPSIIVLVADASRFADTPAPTIAQHLAFTANNQNGWIGFTISWPISAKASWLVFSRPHRSPAWVTAADASQPRPRNEP